MTIRFLASATVLFACSVLAQGPVELAQNGDFETGDFTGWQEFPSAPGNISIQSPGNSSTYAGCIDNQAAASASLIKNANIGVGTVVPSETVTVSFDAKGSTAVGGVVFAELFSEISGGGVSASVILGGGPLALDPNPNTWTSFSFTTPAGPDVSGGVTLQLAAITGAAPGSISSVCFDNVSVMVQGSPPSGNLLTNADFEAGLTGWSSFGNAFAAPAAAPEIVPLSGNQVCKMYGLFGPGFDVSGIFQSFPAAPGESFTMDCFSRQWSGDPLLGAGPPGDNWAVMKIAFFDASNTEIGSAEATVVDGTSPHDTWIDNAPITGTAPAGTASVQALLLFLQPATAGGAAQFEDVSFELAVPPTTGNLLANPDFEAALSGWSVFGNAYPEPGNPPAVTPLSGSGVCKMFGNFSSTFNVTGIYQSFPAAAGESFTIDAWSRHWSGDALTGAGAPNDNWVVMKIAFFDAGNTEIGSAEGTILNGNSPTDTWIDNAPVNGTAPAGTASVQALILFLQPNNAGGAAHIEDVLFERNCSTLTITGPGTPSTSLSLDLNGEANAFAYMLIGVTHGLTSFNYGPLGTLELGIASPFLTAPLGMTDGNGDASLIINLPGSGLANTSFLAQGLTIEVLAGPTLSFCTSPVQGFSISGY